MLKVRSLCWVWNYEGRDTAMVARDKTTFFYDLQLPFSFLFSFMMSFTSVPLLPNDL